MEIEATDGLNGISVEDTERKRWGRLYAAFDKKARTSHLAVASIAMMTGQAIRDKNVVLGLCAQAALGSPDPNLWLNLTSVLADCGPEWAVPFRTASEETEEILRRHEDDIDPDRMREARATLHHNMSVMAMKTGSLIEARTHAMTSTSLRPQRAVFWFQLGNVFSRMDSAWSRGPEDRAYWDSAIRAYECCLYWCGSDKGEVNPDVVEGWGDPDGNTRTGLRVVAMNAIRSLKLARRDQNSGPIKERWLNYPDTPLTRKLASSQSACSDIYADRRLGIYMEQGLGDQIETFQDIADLLTVLAAKGMADDVLVCVPKANLRLMQESMPLNRKLALGYISPGVQQETLFESRPWIGSLDARSLLVEIENGDARRNWSVADSIRKSGIQSSVLSFIPKTGERNIGLCWRGSPGHPGDWARSVRDDLVAGILENRLDVLGDSRLYSLQKPFHPGQFKVPEIVADLGPHITDSYDLAKAIMGMNVVVTVDTVVAHLCALLGVPCFMALPYHPDARWGFPPKDRAVKRFGPHLSAVWQDPPAVTPAIHASGTATIKPPSGVRYPTEKDYACHSMAYAWDKALLEALQLASCLGYAGGRE